MSEKTEIVTQALTIKIRLKPNPSQNDLLKRSSTLYIATINRLVSEMVESKAITKKTSKHVDVELNSAVKNQAIRDAKSVFQKAKKMKFSVISILKKPVITFNNQNFSTTQEGISFPLMVDGKSTRMFIKAIVNEREWELLQDASKVGSLRITKKGEDWVAQIAIEKISSPSSSRKVMGVDLGVKVPAVCVTDVDEVRFFGKGRQNKYVRRYHYCRRKRLGKQKKIDAIRASKHKEQRYMQNQDHKISRQIVDFAVRMDVGVIHVEKLANIRKTTRTSRKNNRSLHAWSFYRLIQCIEYKAALVGIKVQHVDPKYTSQSCPACGERNKTITRSFYCKQCQYKDHRDVVGAKNIRFAPVSGGNS
ncbi:RNA-guided endonuclease InsQ/TnpB family protein [Geomicrobium sediminis]|uniref:Transposase n=1 Tax=Geomicrobium sediminis TaxID=1347788 RepID=A0ABS2PFN1_9BACL|nr:RNA-guided endonuclease TnpB family protein [Geomicrobium sediminis]MBM7634215.1 putative transposase [Geomicrobium sediminis]